MTDREVMTSVTSRMGKKNRSMSLVSYVQHAKRKWLLAVVK